jgi:hypothetical protein
MMKKKMLALLFIGILCLSLSACGESTVKTSQDDSSFEKKMLNIVDDEETESTEKTEGGQDGQMEIPDAVINISPEDDQALTGVLTEDSYTNDYFGLKLGRCEGGTIKSFMDSGTDLMPLSEAYAEGIGSIIIQSQDAGDGSYVSMSVSALTSKEQGKDGEVLAMERLELEQKLGSAVDRTVETMTVAGEEHTAYVEITDSEEGRTKAATIYMIKGDFQCIITVCAAEDRFDEMLNLIEKI